MKPRKKKLMLVTPYFHPQAGGLEQYALSMAEGVKERGWDVVIVTSNPAKLRPVDSLRGMRIYRLPVWAVVSNTPVNPLWALTLKRIIKKEQPDVVNAHTPVPFMADMAALAVGETPFVVTYHAATLRKSGRALSNLLLLLYGPLQRMTLRKADAVIAVSDYVKASLPRAVMPKTEVVYNAASGVSRITRKREGMIFVGSLNKTHSWKGLDQILLALAQYKQLYGVELPFTVVGDGDAKVEYERLTHELALRQVRFTGYKGGRVKEELIASARALVAYPTSGNDAFPTVFLESWATSTPVIASAIGPIPSLVRHAEAGLLVPSRSPRQLAAAMRFLINEPVLAERLGKNGRELVRSRYNWRVQIKKTVTVLEKI